MPTSYTYKSYNPANTDAGGYGSSGKYVYGTKVRFTKDVKITAIGGRQGEYGGSLGLRVYDENRNLLVTDSYRTYSAKQEFSIPNTTFGNTNLIFQANKDYYIAFKSNSGGYLGHESGGSRNTTLGGVGVTISGQYYDTSGNDVFPASLNSGSTASISLTFEPLNQDPTLMLTSPANNLVLTEGTQFLVEGSVTDADNGNVITVKYKINNGTARALDSTVSDGTTSFNFGKALRYSNKRIWDGTVDVTGVDLAENTNHTLTVWAEDDQGGKSEEVTRTFQVIWNRPPVISGSDTDLGVINTIPTFTYSVTDPEGNDFTITEYLNGQQTKSFSGVAGQEYTITFDHDTWLRLALGTPHQVKVRATDSNGQYSERIFTFTRLETKIEFMLKQPFHCDARPSRVLVTLDANIPTGATQKIEVCNNAYDAEPTWEDITSKVIAGRGHIFDNETKTASDWGINIRFEFSRGTATQPVLINGFGGAFD